METSGLERHLSYMRLALDLARKSPPKPTNFCVGTVLLDPTKDEVLSTGYTLELEGNTHAEQCCLTKLATQSELPENRVGEIIPLNTILYTTMEPCSVRLSGNLPCVQRILNIRKDDKLCIGKVVCGVKEPEKFVGENLGRALLENAGITVLYVNGLEDEILAVATAGHEKTKLTS